MAALGVGDARSVTRTNRRSNARAIKIFYTCPSFPPVFSLFIFSFRFTTFLKSFLSINNQSSPPPPLIQTLCPHLGRSTPPRKTFTVHHYLSVNYFQQFAAVLNLTWPSLDTACNFTYTLKAPSHPLGPAV